MVSSTARFACPLCHHSQLYRIRVAAAWEPDAPAAAFTSWSCRSLLQPPVQGGEWTASVPWPGSAEAKGHQSHTQAPSHPSSGRLAPTMPPGAGGGPLLSHESHVTQRTHFQSQRTSQVTSCRDTGEKTMQNCQRAGQRGGRRPKAAS